MMYRVIGLGLILLATAPAWGEDTLLEEITARAWAIADSRTGELLWGLNEDKPAKAASTTKMMCVWVVLRLAEADPGICDQRWEGFRHTTDEPVPSHISVLHSTAHRSIHAR